MSISFFPFPAGTQMESDFHEQSQTQDMMQEVQEQRMIIEAGYNRQRMIIEAGYNRQRMIIEAGYNLQRGLSVIQKF